MAKWWEYQPWRRKALIAILWAVFGSSLAIAAVVSTVQQRKLESKFSPPLACGPFTVRVPVGWSTRLPTGGSLRIDAVESSTLKRLNRPRRLLFIQKSLAPGTTLDEFVAKEPSLSARSFLQPDDMGEVDEVTIAGYPGVAYFRVSAPIFAASPVYEYIGATITPEGQAVAIKLLCDGKPSEDDAPLLQTVLDRVAVRK